MIKYECVIKLYVNTFKGFEEIDEEKLKEYKGKYVIWFDLFNPTEEEIEFLRKQTGFSMPPKEILGDIEISSKYIEDKDYLEVTLSFVIPQKEEILVEPVVFYIKEKFFVTVRYRDIPSIMIFKNRTNFQRKFFQFPESLFAEILGIEVDRIGDRLELLGNKIKDIWRQMFVEQSEEMIRELAFYDELNITLRESINEKIRIITKALKSPLINAHTKKELRIIYEDLTTLLEYTSFYMEKIDSIQNSLLGLITIRQNEAVKVFTVLATIFLPATLIASIFGMNFKHMPELHWKYGYPYSLFLMVFVTLVLLFWVRRKGWL
ncbi:Mg(2+) and Co(2+) transport protein [Aquifex aeolicus VF5]|uniref:Magnesium transport protein CorA n=1 Tax=Aquifex aeolicus (strain VF5) TaxID=224324 RepID=O67018_AQUAE|nr:Mg(2+) and Co(2+) transport protein [Aquifex aeolicus VF5]